MEGLGGGGVFSGGSDDGEPPRGVGGEKNGSLSTFENLFEKNVFFELFKGRLGKRVARDRGELIETKFIRRAIDRGGVVSQIHAEGEFLGIGNQVVQSILHSIQLSKLFHPLWGGVSHFLQLPSSPIKIGLPSSLDGLGFRTTNNVPQTGRKFLR